MFIITQDGPLLRMQSPTSTIELLPKSGAIFNKWQVQMHGKAWNVIEGYDSPEDFDAQCEAKGFRSCKLSPYVCRIPNGGKYTFTDIEYKVGKFDLNGASIHGLLYNAPFEIAFFEAGEEHAMVALQYHYQATDAGYPFNYFIEVVYFLLPDDTLKITTTVYNQHEETIPIADGWHPYFSLGRPIDELYFEMASDHMLVFDERIVPTGDLKPENRFEFLHSLEDVSLDNCFLMQKPLLGPACALVNTLDKIALTITPDDSYPYLQVYTPPHRNSIAIENLSAAPDAFNNRMGLIILDPDEQATFTTTYQITPWN